MKILFFGIIPHAVEYSAVLIDMQQFIWNCDIMYERLLLVSEIGVRDPHAVHQFLVQLQAVDVTVVVTVPQSGVHPYLPEEYIHWKVLK